MSTLEINQLLEEGIAALKAGKRDQARELLMRIVTADERNARGWLWLSGAVDTEQDRRICLENVLALDPGNVTAQRGLAQLDARTSIPANKADVESKPETAVSPPETIQESEPDWGIEPPTSQTVRREYKPISNAMAILHPEKQVQEWEWNDPTKTPETIPDINIQATSSFHDVWTQDIDLCPYCAHELGLHDTQCGRCRRPLQNKQFRYPEPSNNIHLLWVMLIGVGQVFLLKGLYDLLILGNGFLAIIDGLLLITFLILAVGIYWRQTWAHLSSIIILILIIVYHTFTFLVPIELPETPIIAIDLVFFTFSSDLILLIGTSFKIFQVSAAIFGLYFAIFQTGPDFDTIKVRQTAKIRRRYNTGEQYHAQAQKMAQNGEWATAILHWQRAAAKQPTQISYQYHLGHAYAQLGFFERSQNVLESAKAIARQPEMRQKIDNLLNFIAQQQATPETAVADANNLSE